MVYFEFAFIFCAKRVRYDFLADDYIPLMHYETLRELDEESERELIISALSISGCTFPVPLTRSFSPVSHVFRSVVDVETRFATAALHYKQKCSKKPKK